MDIMNKTLYCKIAKTGRMVFLKFCNLRHLCEWEIKSLKFALHCLTLENSAKHKLSGQLRKVGNLDLAGGLVHVQLPSLSHPAVLVFFYICGLIGPFFCTAFLRKAPRSEIFYFFA